MDVVFHHASIASMSLIGSSVLTVLALTNPVGLVVLTLGGITLMVHRHDRHRKK